jgi:NADH-quinone oxidoreductase subunit J
MNRPTAFAVFVVFLTLVTSTIAREPLGPTVWFEGTTQEVGTQFFTTFLVPFEVLSVILLAAMVGAIYIAKKEVP